LRPSYKSEGVLESNTLCVLFARNNVLSDSSQSVLQPRTTVWGRSRCSLKTDKLGSGYSSSACSKTSSKVSSELHEFYSGPNFPRLCDNIAAFLRKNSDSRGAMAETISTNQFRNGAAVRVDGKRFTILYFQHVKPGKGGAFVRTRLRNLDTGAVIEKTFRAGEKVESVRTESRPMQFLYRDGDLFYFMDSETYEQIGITADVLGESAGYIVPNGEVKVLSADGEVVSVEPPAHVDLEVTQTDPGLKGDTATGGSKPATLETGLVVQVPLFVNVGERVRVDTRTNEYLTRV
jgi:elongation factor P